MGNKLFVGNLSYSVENEELKRQFSEFGDVKTATVMKDRYNNNRSKGFGFVEMSSEKEAKAAILGLNNKSVDGRNLIVNEARPMSPKTPRAGSPSGRSGGGRRDGSPGGRSGGGRGEGGGGYGGGNQRY